MQQCSSLNLTEYWVNLIHDFLPSVRCIEAYGRGIDLAIQANQRVQTHLLLNGETYSALSNLDGYVLKLVDDLKIRSAVQANRLIDESIDLYQHQYTIKALLQTVLTAELIAQFEQHDSQQIQSNLNQELILLLLWARIFEL